jgi:hypothetical protein
LLAIVASFENWRHFLEVKKKKTKILWAKQTSFLAPCPSALGQLEPHGFM